MSLAEAYKDGRELRRLLTGGYEEDLRQQRELKQAQIAESRQRTQASKDRIALAQKSEERVRRNQLMMNLYKFKILPELTSMKNRNASQEELDAYSSELSADYPDIMSVFGKDGLHFKKRNRQIEFDITTTLTKDNISQYFRPGTPEHSLFMDEIGKSGNNQMRVTISGGENGTLQIESIKRNYLEKLIGKNMPDDFSEQVVNMFDAWDKADNKNGGINTNLNKNKTKGERFKEWFGKAFSNPANDKYVADNFGSPYPTPDKEAKSTSVTKSANDIQPAKERKFKVGQIVETINGDHKFNGGDPTDPSNWSKI